MTDEWETMRYRPWQSLLFLASMVLLAPATAAADTDSHGEALIQWLESKGGYFNPALELRRADKNDSSSRLGVFATDAIEEKKLLLVVPPDCLITAGAPVEDADPMECDTVRNLITEMKLGDDSQFAPYVKYLLSQSPGQLPSAWSQAGKDLLIEILGERHDVQILPPEDAVGWLETDWHKGCNGSNDSLEEQAAMLAVQHGWNDVIVPIYDMMRHRNGHWLNTESSSISFGEKFDVRASRDIEAGEEIYTTYNLCNDCADKATTYGTPEIFRDYGFVEEYPQRWSVPFQRVAFELDEKGADDGTTGSGELKVSWLRHKPFNSSINFLRGQLQRLNELAEIELESPDESVPKNEWDAIWQYHQALTVAMTHVIAAARGEDSDKCLNGEGSCAVSSDRYDELEEHFDDLEYDSYTCKQDWDFPEYDVIEEIHSPYQEIVFIQDPKNKDVCFELDGTYQICGCYRPHYHEMVVHYTARFLDNIKRVVFVGGGDSMLLHEIIKYPSLELVVGLELDQKVTRHSFKHFGTQPHWDNEKVQWWFGDATKSLLMLPKEYFGSFDMVLVDLSETVMSFLVTDELDVMEALSLLLKPEGILVKNELYLEKLSDIFDYTIQIHYYDVPVICSQALIMGSNKIDFLYRDLKDHNIENLFIKPLEHIKDRYEIFHDYLRNNTGAQRHCKDPNEAEEEPVHQKRSPGILMIVEAEDAAAELWPSEKVKDSLVQALTKEGLTVVSTVKPTTDHKGAVVVVILREGYVMARTWPQHKYCAFDIHLWSSFEKHDRVKKALLAAVGSSSGSSSSYRIVAGGMFGLSTWKENEKNRGPRLTQLCDRPAGSVRDAPFDESAIDIVVEESMSLVQDSDIVVGVVCGDRSQPCNSLEVLDKNERVREVVALWTCPNIKGGVEYLEDGSERMIACEKDVLKTLKESLTEGKKLRAIIVDPSAPFAMVQVVHSIFSIKRNWARMLTPDFMVMTTMLDATETWRRYFLDRFRKDIVTYEPVFRAEVVFNSSDSSMEMGVTSSGDFEFVKHLVDATANIEKRTGLVSDVRNIQNGLFNHQPDFVPSQFFLPSDYDQRSPLEQWTSQQPLGHQSIFQLEVQGEGDKTALTTAQLKDALEHTLSLMKLDVMSTAELQEFTNAGDGCVLVALWSGGSAIVLWDGRIHVDINLFTHIESVELANEFAKRFKEQIPKLDTVLRDEQPRGFGRVVNFLVDIEPRADPHWA